MGSKDSRMGVKSKAVLECLRKNGKLNGLDLEMKLNMGKLSNVTGRLFGLGYVKNFAGQKGLYEITKAGREALGESISLETPAYTKICNGTSTEVYNPAVHLSQRYGVARV